ncbi:MAG TPA: ABC transporter ATP-binding protein [Xanthobacteraceae bacterium]|nr:ABC transporter ATP-binding protein [Xanthobacteraceae bacterium]
MKLYLLLLHDIVKRLRWRFPLLIIWTVLVGLGEGFSVILLLPLLSRIGIAAASGQGIAIRLLDSGLALIGATGALEIVAVMVMVVAAQTALSIGLTWWTAILARRYQSQHQLELFGALMRAKWTFIANEKAGELTNAIITESDRLGGAFTLYLSLLGSVMVTIVYIVLSLIIAWQVALGLIGIAAASALAMTQLYRKTYAVGRTLAPLNAEFQSVLTEHFAGAKYIKASASIDRAMARVKALVQKIEKTHAFANSLPGTVRSLLEALAVIGLAIILLLGSRLMGVATGNVVVVLALFGRLFPRITALQANLHHLNWNVPAIEAISVLQTAAEAKAERQDYSSEPLQIDKPTTFAVRNLQIRFDDRIVLDDINLTVPIPGLLAIVGRSGAGKSTLVHALLGLVEPSAGSIRLGPYDLASAPLSAWRRTIGFVPQETILFHASIKDNLTLLNPAASDADIEIAARRAHALDFIRLLPNGFDTIIGDQGVKLSGGQRQRLGIARALLNNPALLVMDEPMSALDTESEAELLRTIEELRKQIGILLVAHRLAAARTADTVCVFEAGRIVEAGRWNELMLRKKRLYALAEAQSLGEDRAVAAL